MCLRAGCASWVHACTGPHALATTAPALTHALSAPAVAAAQLVLDGRDLAGGHPVHGGWGRGASRRKQGARGGAVGGCTQQGGQGGAGGGCRGGAQGGKVGVGPVAGEAADLHRNKVWSVWRRTSAKHGRTGTRREGGHAVHAVPAARQRRPCLPLPEWHPPGGQGPSAATEGCEWRCALPYTWPHGVARAHSGPCTAQVARMRQRLTKASYWARVGSLLYLWTNWSFMRKALKCAASSAALR